MTGQLPFAEPPILTVILNNGALSFVPLTQRCPGLGAALSQAIERCLTADPASRPTAAELASTLTDALPC